MGHNTQINIYLHTYVETDAKLRIVSSQSPKESEYTSDYLNPKHYSKIADTKVEGNRSHMEYDVDVESVVGVGSEILYTMYQNI